MLDPSDAALSFAKEAGLVAEEASLIADSSRSVFLLEPCSVVAKVTTLNRSKQMQTELSVCSHVQRSKGPVVPPLLRGSPGPYTSNDWIATLWENCPSERSVEALESDALMAYLELRPHLDSFEGALPSFSEPILRCAQGLADLSHDQLSRAEIASLERVLGSFERLDLAALETCALHGDPHAGNLTYSCFETMWLDLESACVGPLEWDLTSLPGPGHFEPPNQELKEFLDYVRSACVVVWCVSKGSLSPAEEEAVRFHLDRVARGPAA